MHDLDLWQALTAGGLRETAVPLLHALARLPLERRWPYLAPILPCTQDERPEVRAAAVACLAGARGRQALRTLVRALDDADAAVCDAAMAALRSSALDGSLRWVHAVFHPRPEVRRAAVDPAARLPLPAWYALYLLADPACAAAASHVLRPESLPLDAVPLLVEYLLTRRAQPPHLRRAVLAAPLSGLLTVLMQTLPSATEIAAAMRQMGAAYGTHSATAAARDCPLGTLLELFWDAGTDEADVWKRQWLDVLTARDDRLPDVCAALLYRIGCRRNTWPLWAVRLLAVCCPASLGCDQLPLTARRDAVGILTQRGSHAPVLTRNAIDRLLHSPLCRTPDGRLDLPAVIAVLHLAHQKPYDRLKHAFDWAEVQTALEQDPQQVADLLALPRADRAGRWGLIDRLLRGRSPRLDHALAQVPPELTGGLVVAPDAPEATASPRPTDYEAITLALTSTDTHELLTWLSADDVTLAQVAAWRLAGMDEAARRQLAGRLARSPALPCAEAVVDALLPTPYAGALLPLALLTAGQQFRLELRQASERGEDIIPRLLEAACDAASAGWLTEDDWCRLAHQPPELLTAYADRLARCPHPFAYGLGVSVLTRGHRHSATAESVLQDFLEAGDDRDHAVRVEAARWLRRHGKKTDLRRLLPIVLQGPQDKPAVPEALGDLPAVLAEAATESVLLSGLGETAERLMLALLMARQVDPLARDRGLGRLTSRATAAAVRREAGQQLRRTGSFFLDAQMRRLAEVFAWGVRIGRELTNLPFGIEMITGEELGFTRLNEQRIFVSPLPYLLGHQQGEEVVRALILHEYGHHLYHKGPEPETIWQQAEREGLGRLLNLVADEHLERNLRARDRRFGDLLKTLAAYAFQHNTREIPVPTLLGLLKGRAAEALSATHLGVARRPDCVVVSSGNLLHMLEESGTSFARFVKALRMGLGDRHRDEKVARGLALFKDGFRHSDMAKLMDITRKLREIFGAEVELLSFLVPSDAEILRELEEHLGQSIPDLNARLREEVREILEDRKARDRASAEHGRGGTGLNLGSEEHFDRIEQVIPLAHDPARHADYARRVGRAAEKMRECLHDLGIGLRPQRFRTRGRAFDRSRTRALLLHGDPRILLARELSRVDDLFLGVVIDCSGSMAGAYMEKARLFGTLLADAARDNRGIDLRIFGFTDQVLYDAGTARRCAAHALQAGGGNNDAGALWHAAQHALASSRKMRLLVMISDGLPTECTVAALKGLVQRLTHRFHVCCAQVAVRHLEEICFPHYILLREDDLQASVVEFGAVILRLVRQVMRG
jgi:hypothetical protein